MIYKTKTITYILNIQYGSVGQHVALDTFEKQMLLIGADISKYNILDKWHERRSLEKNTIYAHVGSRFCSKRVAPD